NNGIKDISIYDNDNPVITDVDAQPPPQIQGGYVNITCTVEDNIEVESVNVSITGPGGFDPVNTTMDEGIYYYNARYTIAGSYNYFIWANDTSGNANTSSIFTFDIWDITPPEIMDVLATPSSVPQGGDINITCTVTDNVEVDMVNVSISGHVGFDPVNVSMDEGGYYYNRSYDIAGTYEYFIWVNDTIGNANTSITYFFVIEDTTPPEISNVTITTSDPLDTDSPFGWENITCIVTDNVLVNQVKLVVTNDTITAEYAMDNIPETDTYECNITLMQPR
ncbi:unnamed protein product, partial [marine sediment metagenome]